MLRRHKIASTSGGGAAQESKRQYWLGLMGLASLAATMSAQAADVNAVFDHLLAVKPIEEAVIAPDGARVAWVSDGIRLTPIDATATAMRLVTAKSVGSKATHGVAWSRDGSKIAFLDDAQRRRQFQLYETTIADRPRRLTNLTGALTSPAWSPDGKVIAFLFIENAPRAAGPLVASAAPTGVIDERVFAQRLAVVDVASGQVRQLTPPDLYVYDFDWSPIGDRLAITAAHGSGDGNWWVAQLWVVDAANGATRSILKPQMQIEWPVWSPDGRSIAFIGGLMSDEDIGAGDVYVIDAAGGAARNLTPDMKASATWPRWVAPDRLLFSAHQDGGSAIFSLNPLSNRLERIWRGDEYIGRSPSLMGFSIDARGGRLATIRESYTQPPEVWAGPIGGWSQMTNLNTGAHVEWGRIESVHWKNEGFDVQGWLLSPRDYDPSKRYPMIVEVHGGHGENLIDQWMIPFFGASVYDDPAVYARSAPINFVKQVKTPTLMLVGERDAECPAPSPSSSGTR